MIYSSSATILFLSGSRWILGKTGHEVGKQSGYDTRGHDLAAKKKTIAIIWQLYAFKPNNKMELENFNKIWIYCICRKHVTVHSKIRNTHLYIYHPVKCCKRLSQLIYDHVSQLIFQVIQPDKVR